MGDFAPFWGGPVITLLTYGLVLKRWRSREWAAEEFYKVFERRSLTGRLLQKFSKQHRKMIWTGPAVLLQEMLEYHTKYGAAPTPTALRAAVEQKTALSDKRRALVLATLEQVEESSPTETEDFGFHLTQAIEGSAAEQAAHSLDRLKEMADDAGPLEALDWLTGELTSIRGSLSRRRADAGDSCFWSDLVAAELEQIDDAEEGVVTYPNYIRWPWESWHDATGVLKPGETTILLANHSQGKSYIAHAPAYEMIRQKKTVVCVELELNRRQCTHRKLAYFSGVPINKIEQRILTPDEKERLYAAKREIDALAEEGGRMIFISPSQGRTVQDIDREVRRLIGNDPVAGFVIDYIAKMVPSRRRSGSADSAYQLLIDVLDEIKFGLTEEYDCPCLSMGHLNRQGQSNFKAYEDKADTIIQFGHVKSCPYEAPQEHIGDWFGRPGIIKAEVTRGRSIPTGNIMYLETLFSTGHLKDLPKNSYSKRLAELTGSGS